MMAAKVRQILDMNAFDAQRDGRAIASQDALLERRQRNLGEASVLFYQRPLTFERASGCWVQDREGEWYLDFYNNVPSVGHCHPRVVAAVSRQIATLNINSRYLTAPLEDYLDNLKSRLPDHLSNVVLTCTGSEANDLALRIADLSSGGTGIIVTETAYHGNTSATTGISPSSYKRGKPPSQVCTVPAPSEQAFGKEIGPAFARAVRRAISTLKRRGHEVSAFICDSIFSSDGVYADPPGFLADAVQVVHEAGGLYIADEVQPGFARTGSAMWGFERHNVSPDIVTMGKPMGNGFPMAGLATKPDHLARFCRKFGYFNTFGANPVAAAAGLAVLEVIDDEGLQENAAVVGAALRAGLDDLARRDERLAEVRGAGLFIGIDLCRNGDPAQPDPGLATQLINGLKARHVLIGAAGKYGHTLKVRPPLCLNDHEADLFCKALRDTLSELV